MLFTFHYGHLTMSFAQANTTFRELWRANRPILRTKQIRSKQRFTQAMRHDLHRIAYALLAVRNGRATDILTPFFGAAHPLLPEVTARLCEPTIDHVGFAVNEPMDAVVSGFEHWVRHYERKLGTKISILDKLRFPASQAFQDRVGGYAEIMRIWLHVDKRSLMLELFDIHRPIRTALPNDKPQTQITKLYQETELTAEHRQMIADLFQPDPIWHYAFGVRDTHDVEVLHQILGNFRPNQDTYSLAYPKPVYNPSDRSFHTKIIGRNHHTELEFVAIHSG